MRVGGYEGRGKRIRHGRSQNGGDRSAKPILLPIYILYHVVPPSVLPFDIAIITSFLSPQPFSAHPQTTTSQNSVSSRLRSTRTPSLSLCYAFPPNQVTRYIAKCRKSMHRFPPTATGRSDIFYTLFHDTRGYT